VLLCTGQDTDMTRVPIWTRVALMSHSVHWSIGQKLNSFTKHLPCKIATKLIDINKVFYLILLSIISAGVVFMPLFLAYLDTHLEQGL
jgi:hypothetical protein